MRLLFNFAVFINELLSARCSFVLTPKQFCFPVVPIAETSFYICTLF